MDFWRRLVSAVGARQILLGLGISYIVFAAGRAIVQLFEGTPLGNVLIVTLLIVIPGFALIYGGYRLSQFDIHPEFYPNVASWCLAGFGAMMSILILYHLQPEGGISTPLTSPPILTALSSVAGFAIGINDGQAKTRTRELEQRNQELEQTQSELEETVAQLKMANERLEESNERLEQFAHAASHDLQEPLRMVSTYLQLIERRYEDQLDEEGQEFFEFAVDGANRMREMIKGLLQYSRVETKGDPLEPVDLETVLGEARDDLQIKIEESDATITADPLPCVEGDPNQLRQVLQNLLDNAIEYSGDEQPYVHISAERNTTKWMISVHDEGIGIDSGDADQVFEVFQSLHSSEEYTSTGIGLALCERIIERHGGDIWVESEPGRGSTFTFTLPAEGSQ